MGIKYKIFLLGSLLPIVALVVFAGYTLTQTKNLSLSGIDRATTLSNNAAVESRKTLEQHGKKIIVNQSENRALYCYQALARISDLTSALALEASSIWNGKVTSTSEKAYQRLEAPLQPGTESVVRIAPASDMTAVNRDIAYAVNLNPFFRKAKTSNPIIKSIYIGTETGLHFRMPWVAAHQVGYDPRERSWYKDAVVSGRTGWSDPYTSASEGVLMVTCYAPAYDSSGKLIGVIGVDVSLATLNETLLKTSYEGGVGVLLDRDGDVVAFSDGGDGVVSALVKNKTVPSIKDVFDKLMLRKAGLVQAELDGEDMFIVFNPIGQTNWTLCILVPVGSVNSIAHEIGKKIVKAKNSTSDELSQQLAKTRNHALLALAVILMSFLVLAYRISRSIIDPVLLLTKGAKNIGEGDFKTKLDIRSGDELEQLAESFNTMGDELNEYMLNLEKTTSEKERIQSELNIATDIQASMLPRIFPAFPDIDSIDVFASMTPAKEVGGDFYDFFLLGENKVCIAIGDVSDKGVPAALFMVISKTLLQNCVRSEPDDLGKAITNLNKDLCKDNDQMLFVTIFCAVIDFVEGTCEYVNAGHNPPAFIKNGDADYISAKPVFPVCGVMDNIEYRSGKLSFSDGDKFFLYTDGITEAFDVDRQQYGEGRLIAELKRNAEKPIKEVVAQIGQSIKRFSSGAVQSDDITMLLFEYHETKTK